MCPNFEFILGALRRPSRRYLQFLEGGSDSLQFGIYLGYSTETIEEIIPYLAEFQSVLQALNYLGYSTEAIGKIVSLFQRNCRTFTP